MAREKKGLFGHMKPKDQNRENPLLPQGEAVSRAQVFAACRVLPWWHCYAIKKQWVGFKVVVSTMEGSD